MPRAPIESYRCVECGVYWERWWPRCARCFRQQCIVPWARRARAAIDGVPGTSNARALSRMAWSTVDHDGAYPELTLGAGALVIVYGLPGAGKSTVACRLVDAVKGPVLLCSAEEGLSPSLAARLLRANIKRADFNIITRSSVDSTVKYARELGAVALVIDSVQEASYTAHELRHIVEVVESLSLLVAVLQTTKDGEPAGAQALLHEADVVVRVESMRWSLTKSRYQDLGVGGTVLPSSTEERAA